MISKDLQRILLMSLLNGVDMPPHFCYKFLYCNVKYLFIFYILILPFLGVAQFSTEQQLQIDSLSAIVKETTDNDTLLAKSYLTLSDILYVSNYDTIIPLCTKAREIAEEGLKKKEVISNPSITYSLKKTMADAIGNIGYFYGIRGDIEKQTAFYHESLKIREEIGDKYGISSSLNNIGYVYRNQNDLEKALEYYKKSLAIREELGNKNGVALSLNNIGFVYNIQGNIEKTLEYYYKSLEIRKEMNHERGIGISYNNLAFVYEKQGDIEKALEYYGKALEIRERIKDKRGMGYTLNNIGNIEIRLGNLVSAREKLTRVFKLAMEDGSPDVISLSAKNLAILYKKENNYKEAYEMYKLHIQMRDSINSEKTQKATIQQEAKYEFEKKQAIRDKEYEKQIALEHKEKEKQELFTYVASGGMVLVLAFLIFIFNRYKVTQKQKNVIEEQKDDIVASITYAKRIQDALLRNEKLDIDHLPDHFMIFKPKDIVSGDFYWTLEKKDHLYIAVVDCTGHGVPGGFLTMLGASFLNEICSTSVLVSPGDILNKLREKIINELAADGSTKDGMDISLLKINLKTHQIAWAGANNPLYIFRNPTRDDEGVKGQASPEKGIEIIKGDRQPIGHSEELHPFTNHEIQLQKGDQIYLFTDGFADQFGGPENKKFSYKRFRELLKDVATLPMKEQKEILAKTFVDWIAQGEDEQVDDVCVIGVRL